MLEYLTCEVKGLDEQGTFTGAVAVYNNVDEQGDKLLPGAVTNLDEIAGGLPLLWSHDQSQPVGKLTLRDTPAALIGEGKLALSLPKAREVYTMLREGLARGLSIGYRVVRSRYEDGIRLLEKIKLYEASIVVLPANPLARITAVKRAYPPAGDLAALIEANLSPAAVTGDPMLLFRQVTAEIRNFRLT